MKIQIRRGVFETNSSSTHALCLGKNPIRTTDHIDFGKLTDSEQWNSENTLQYRADILFAAIIRTFRGQEAFIRLGKLEKLLGELGITYTFNLGLDYLENDLPYVAEEFDDMVEMLLGDSSILERYLFDDLSSLVSEDRDSLYLKGGWGKVFDTSKCDIYD